LLERAREQLRLAEYRMSWQAGTETTYRDGILRAGISGDTRTAFELVERSRSRAFVDQLATGHLPLPESAQGLLEIEARLKTEREVLEQLRDAADRYGVGFIDPELLRQLAAIDDGAKVLERAPEGGMRVSLTELERETRGVQQRLASVQREIEEARMSAVQVAASPAIGVSELQSLLKD
jgi:hypothetical protein